MLIKTHANHSPADTSRRRFLRNMVLGSASALTMSSLSQLALAQTSKLKVVFAVIPDGFAVDSYSGYNNGLWYPTVSGTESTNFAHNVLPQQLGAYANDALYLRGLLLGSGTGGHNAWTTILRDSNASQTSIDNILGNAMPGTNAAIKRLYAGPHAMVGASWNISYQNNSMILPEDNPYQLYDAVYGNFTDSSNTGTNASANTHIFDPVLEDIKQLQSVLGASERAKLTTHLDAIEQVVTDLENTVPPSASCDPSYAQPAAGLNINSPDYRNEVTQAHSNIVASALSCGSTRVATLQIGRSADQVVIKSVSGSRNPHDCAHRYGSVDEWKGSREWYVQQVKYLLDRLSAYPDPDSPGDSLLDHTLVVFTSEMADGAPEHMQDLPITLLGGASGLLNKGNGNGRYLDLSNQGDRTHWKLGQCTDVQRVWSTIARACGTSVPYGGDTSVLSGIFTNVG